MKYPIKVAQYGLGPIGRKIIEIASTKRRLQVVGGVDIDPSIIGKNIGELIGVGNVQGKIFGNARELFDSEDVDLVYIATSSHLNEVYSQIMECIKFGKNVISTCEELFYPQIHLKIAEKIDKAARENGVTVVGTGVNPGFIFDTFICSLTSICKYVNKIEGIRVQDASKRRKSFQQKIGAGLTVDEFKREILNKKGHVGFSESVSLVASVLGWKIDRIEEKMEPVIAAEDVSSEYITVKKGNVAGIRQIVEAYDVSGDRKIRFEIRFYIGAKSSYDKIKIEGVPPINLEINPGIEGDTATAAICVNMTEEVVKAESGLKTMLDFKIPRLIS